MGADLYINKLYKANRNKYQPLMDAWVELRDAHPHGSKEADKAQKKVSYYYDKVYSVGYFRDSYNGSNVLNRLGLSWWKDFDKFIDLKKSRSVSPKSAQKFLDLIRPLPIQEVDAAKLKEMGCVVDDSKNSPESWNKSFHEQKAELVKFLETAIKLKTPIEASI